MKYTFLLLATISLTSCSHIFNDIFLANRCKKCDVVNVATGEIVYSAQGCGGDRTRIELETKAQAYEESRANRNLCDLEVRCSTWKKAK